MKSDLIAAKKSPGRLKNTGTIVERAIFRHRNVFPYNPSLPGL